MPTQYWQAGSWTTVLSTELNSLASTSNVLSSVGGTSGQFTNTYNSSGLGGYPLADVELVLAAPGGTVSAGGSVYLWWIVYDGTNYEDGGSSVTPARSPDVIIPLRAVSTAQTVVVRGLSIPPASFKVLAQNQIGQAFGSSGSTVSVRPTTLQSQ